MPSNTLLQRIFHLEDQKLEILFDGALEKPDLMIRIEMIDRKLDKYYRWYASAFVAEKV